MKFMHENRWFLNRRLVLNILGMSGTGLFILAVIRARLLDHKFLAFLQKVWDSIAGTYGTFFNVLTFLAGASAFAGLWLFCLAALLLRKQRPSLQYAISHITGIFGPAALFSVPGVLALLGGPQVLVLCR